MDVKLLRQVQKDILKFPQRLEMSQWAAPSDLGACNTSFCIGGWTLIEKGCKAKRDKNDQKVYFHRPDKRQTKIEDEEKAAAKMLRITPAQSGRLFFSWNWPVQFKMKGGHGLPLKEAAAIKASLAVARIEHFIATNGAE